MRILLVKVTISFFSEAYRIPAPYDGTKPDGRRANFRPSLPPGKLNPARRIGSFLRVFCFAVGLRLPGRGQSLLKRTTREVYPSRKMDGRVQLGCNRE